MIVYASRKQPRNTAQALRRLRSWPISTPDDVVRTLIEFGEIEAGVIDACCPEWDECNEITERFTQASLYCGHMLAGRRSPDIAKCLASLSELGLPEQIEVSTPEGYAWYGVYPQAYLKAAQLFFEQQAPARVIVIGIRSIGTGLSGVVAAALEALGVMVERYTVRPHGHPFDRTLRLGSAMRARWGNAGQCHFAVVDEGPGLSGSSFASVAKELEASGVQQEQIVFFPSWDPDPGELLNESAQRIWRTHRKFTADAAAMPAGQNLSGGAWRSLLYSAPADYPAVHPQHERIKCLAEDNAGRVLRKFAGLGLYGSAKLQRAQQIAARGFTPAPEGLSNGFLSQRFVDGCPLTRGFSDEALASTMANYLNFLSDTFQVERRPPFEELLEMIEVNVREGLGDRWLALLDPLPAKRRMIEDSTAVAIDGRMLPHEWLANVDGYLKTDALDHHDDHFFPGCQDIAWDVAGAIIEFEWDAAQQQCFLTRMDATLRRLPFYRIAYAAFRLGYAVQSAKTLESSPEALRFHRLAAYYRHTLQAALLLGAS